MRTFIAIDLPEDVKSKIFHEFETLQKKNFFKGKFVEKQNLHLTLSFLGEVSGEKIDEIKKKLREIKYEKFLCSVGKTGVFDNENYIRVIWVELLSDKIHELQNKVCEKLDLAPDKRFNSHLTIARVNSVINKEDLLEYLKKINFKKLGFEVKEFLLIKSELTPRGPIYRVIEKFGLK